MQYCCCYSFFCCLIPRLFRPSLRCHVIQHICSVLATRGDTNTRINRLLGRIHSYFNAIRTQKQEPRALISFSNSQPGLFHMHYYTYAYSCSLNTDLSRSRTIDAQIASEYTYFSAMEIDYTHYGLNIFHSLNMSNAGSAFG